MIKLAFEGPLLPDSLFGHLVATAVPGVEEWRDGFYRRTVRLAHGPGIVALAPGDGHVPADLSQCDERDRDEAVALCRRLLDLDADIVTIDGALMTDRVLKPLVAAAPGRRMPRTVDTAELALRTVLGQQVSTAAARTHAGRLASSFGTHVEDRAGGLTRLSPTPDQLTGIDPAALRMPETRRRTFLGLAAALAGGRVDDFLALPGIGPWTADTIAMRALGDDDAFLVGDLGVRYAARRLGLPERPGALTARAEAWRPYRAYAVLHLWATGTHAVNAMPQ